MPCSTVARVLQRAGLHRLKLLEPQEPPRRYERRRPGDLLHLDIKKLGRIVRVGHRIHGNRSIRTEGAGWEFVHVCIDDRSRLAYVEVLPDERQGTTTGYLERAVAFYRRLDIRVRAVMTDNGPAYLSHLFAFACRTLRLRHLRTRPYRPRTNGKAERFIQTLLREWAYARPYLNSWLRIRALKTYLRYYNRRRPHGALNGRPPISRLPLACEQRV
jgi:transposase InsO family protein